MQTAEQMELAGSEDAAQQMIDGYLHDGTVGRVGLELEAHCIDLADPMRRPTWMAAAARSCRATTTTATGAGSAPAPHWPRA